MLCVLSTRKNPMKISSLAVTVILSLTGTAALAQSVDTNWYIAPVVGPVINDSNRAQNVGVASGLILGKALNDKWNVEVSGQYLRLDGSHDEQGNIGVDALYFLNRNPDFAPYLSLGLGYAAEGNPTGGTGENAMVKVGFGFTKKLSNKVDFRTDARYQLHANRGQANNLGDLAIFFGFNFHLDK